MAVDQRGNVVAIGTYRESFQLDDTEITTEAGGSFVARYNPAGQLQWLQDFEGSLHALATDGSGDIYLGGYTSTSAMLWKLGADGDPVWESPTDVSAKQMAVAPSGDVVVSGWFRDTVAVGGDEATSNGFFDFFVARFNAAGQGVSLVAGGSTLDDRAMGLAVDPLRRGHQCHRLPGLVRVPGRDHFQRGQLRHSGDAARVDATAACRR